MWFTRTETTNQRMLEIGPNVMVDLNQISAVYREGNTLVVRIGGMGVIKLEESQLFGRASEAYKTIKEGIGL